MAAASDLQSALPAIVARFETDTGQHVRLTFGSSGNFFAQIENGAPFDVFLSADLTYPRNLAAAGHADSNSLTLYAVGRLVLWTAKTNLVVTNGLNALTDPSVKRIAIANPQQAWNRVTPSSASKIIGAQSRRDSAIGRRIRAIMANKKSDATR